MADPFTAVGTAAAVLQLAQAAFSLGKAVYQLYTDTKVVDETVKSLIAELNSIGTTCELVHQEIEPILRQPKSGSNSTYDEDGRLWRCIAAEVERVKQTLHDFEGIVERVKEESRLFFTQTTRQVKLNTAKDKMLILRQRIGTHTDCLQTILLTVNM